MAESIWVSEGPDSHRMVVRTGQALEVLNPERLPSLDPNILNGWTIEQIPTTSPPPLNDRGEVAFLARFSQDVLGPSYLGLFIAQRDGDLWVAAREGETLEVRPGEFREAVDFSIHQGSCPERALDEQGRLAFSARLGLPFAPSVQGIFVAPEPSASRSGLASLAALAIVAGVLAGRR